MMKSSSLKTIVAFPISVLLYANIISVLYPIVVTAISHPKNENSSIPALLVFGDSIMDTGNNDYLITLVRANFKPYGRDFPGGKPTGRFGNGRLLSDLLAEALGVKKLLPPFFDPNLQLQDILTGVNFASAGTGYDPLTAKIALALSVKDQVNLFKKYIKKLKEGVGEETTAEILAKGIYIICLVGNDLGTTYYLTPSRSFKYDIDQYTSKLVKHSLEFQQELHRLGARKIGVFSAPPLGCAPLHRTIFGGLERQCIESIDQASMVYNTKLSAAMKALSESLPDSNLVYTDIYTTLLDIIQHPKKFGFEVADKGCCGLLKVETGPLCNPFQKVCKNTSEYVFFDNYHPSENAYKIMSSEIAKKYFDEFF